MSDQTADDQGRLFFSPAVDVVVGMDRFFGSLLVEPQCVRFTPQQFVNKVMTANAAPHIAHTEDPTVAITATLWPHRCSLILFDRNALATAAAVAHVSNANSLLIALAVARFKVEHYHLTVGTGLSIASATELELFREANKDHLTRGA
jgi:hypothetical protein